MKKHILTIFAIVLISINVNSQITQKLLPKRQNIAYFDSLHVYKNFAEIDGHQAKIFIVESKDTLYINDFSLIILSKNRKDLVDENYYRILYECIDINKNKYSFSIYIMYGHSQEGCLIAHNTEMRYGFSHSF